MIPLTVLNGNVINGAAIIELDALITTSEIAHSRMTTQKMPYAYSERLIAVMQHRHKCLIMSSI